MLNKIKISTDYFIHFLAEHKIFITFLTFFRSVLLLLLLLSRRRSHAQFNAQLSTQGALRLPLFHFWSRHKANAFFSLSFSFVFYLLPFFFFAHFVFLSQKFVLCKLFAATFLWKNKSKPKVHLGGEGK